MIDAISANPQFQLRKQQRSLGRPFSDNTFPKWVSTLPQVYSVTDEFAELLEQLPAMQAEPDRITKQLYFKQLVEELVKIYYYRLRIVQLSDKITDQAKPAEEKALIDECKNTIAQLADWLETDGISTVQ